MEAEPHLDILAKIFDLFKAPLRCVIALGIVVSLVLFAPNSVIDKLGFLKYREEGNFYLGVALLLCIAIAISGGIGFLAQRYNNYLFLRAGKKQLNLLTVEEKQILRGYIEGQTRTMHLHIQSGIVNGLVAEKIIYRASSIGATGFAFAYNIQPWAWKYLNKHRDLLLHN